MACRHHSPRGLRLMDSYKTDYVSCLFDHLINNRYLTLSVSLSDCFEEDFVAASMPTCRGFGSFLSPKTNKEVNYEMQNMGESKGYGKGGGQMIPTDKSANSYNVSLKLSPVVSFWDCIVRTMRYIYPIGCSSSS
ncbi:Uncharacterized protein Rs2_07793 [Raphanus sativus]|nr:Uncharacterized protein Rs2_07793 [Raphanus sativus]